MMQEFSLKILNVSKFSKTPIGQKQHVLKYFVYMQLQHNVVANTPFNGPSIINPAKTMYQGNRVKIKNNIYKKKTRWFLWMRSNHISCEKQWPGRGPCDSDEHVRSGVNSSGLKGERVQDSDG